MCADLRSDRPPAREGYIPVENAELYYREIGQGRPILILHGGPDFDHGYLLPDMDRLSDAYRLIYYDQRGRGKSAAKVQPADVSIQSEIDDLEGLRHYLGMESVAVIGHSWGGLLAMEYAIRHPDRLSHLILMNTIVASHEDYMLFHQERRGREPDVLDKLAALSSGAEYAEGDPQAVTEYYRVHFSTTLKQPEHLERVIAGLRSGFTKEGILRAWEIEERLMNETLRSSEYDLLPMLSRLRIPTLVIHGDRDLIPAACAAHIAQAIPGARFVLLRECGHFTYVECPDEVRNVVTDFFGHGYHFRADWAAPV